MNRLEQVQQDFEDAYFRLEEAVNEAETELEIDGAIQRFEFSFQLFWKLLQRKLEREGLTCRSPRGCIKEAYRIGLLDDEESLLEMLEDRNKTVHIYDEAKSREIFRRICERYIDQFKVLQVKVSRHTMYFFFPNEECKCTL